MNTDFLVIGGGVIGINVALELKRRYSDCAVTLLEKETSPGQHASGRNSGVLHAGFYYTADSLKAKFTLEGNRLLRQRCEERGLRLNPCGKLVVARNVEELAGLDELLRRGQTNGVPLESISEAEAKQLEPRVRTFQRALFSPLTATVDPTEIMRSLVEEAEEQGIQVRCNASYRERRGETIHTDTDQMEAGFVVNCAGLYADRIARDFGFGEAYQILPFKGLYLYASEPAGAFRTNIYPVPDLRNPFLGVHFTVTVDGHAKIGPTAIPGFWREHYAGREGFRWEEMREILTAEMGLFLHADFDFRGLALREMRKYYRPYLVRQASELAEGVRAGDYTHWGKAGIRAQLLRRKERKLEMDFVTEGDSRSLHVLNAVSPAFTCSIPFARYVCDQIAAAQQTPTAVLPSLIPNP